MQVKNINELKMNFKVTHLDKTYNLKYGMIVELPDGAVPMEGIRGWVVCRPTPIRPQLIEIDLGSADQSEKYELSEEDQEKANKVIEDSIKETIERSEQNKKRSEEDETEKCEGDSIGDSEDNTREDTGTSEADISSSGDVDHSEDQKDACESVEEPIIKLVSSRISKGKRPPLKGYKLKKSLREARKQKYIKKMELQGGQNYIIEAQRKVDEKLGLS